jgi:hypothetical protein
VSIVTVAELNSFFDGQGVAQPAGWTDAVLQAHLDAAEQWAMTRTGLSFENVRESRLFDGSGADTQLIDDAVDVTAVMIVEASGDVTLTFGTTEYVLYPANALPKTHMKRVQATDLAVLSQSADAIDAATAIWQAGQQNIRVDGQWAYALSLPADLKQAVKMLAAIYALAGSSLPGIGGTVQGALRSYSTGVYSASFSSEVSDPAGTVTGWAKMVDAILSAYTQFRVW